MFSGSELTQQLQQIVDVLIRFIKARRREEASFGLAALLFGVGFAFSGWLPSDLMEFLKPWHGVWIVRIICWAAGLAFLVYGAVSRSRLVYVPALAPPQDRPSAIKGLVAFTEEEGALFWKLGRANELQTLSGFTWITRYRW